MLDLQRAKPLAGRVALITGSTSGIGLGILEAMASAGASVVMNGLGDAGQIDISAAGPGGLIAAGTKLRLFVTFTLGSEQPRLGPIVVLVVDRLL